MFYCKHQVLSHGRLGFPLNLVNFVLLITSYVLPVLSHSQCQQCASVNVQLSPRLTETAPEAPPTHDGHNHHSDGQHLRLALPEPSRPGPLTQPRVGPLPGVGPVEVRQLRHRVLVPTSAPRWGRVPS